MAYYPKSQITTNLYTNGGELFVTSTGQPYSGYYYRLSNGQIFSGRTPQDLPNFPLTTITPQLTPNPTTYNDVPLYTVTNKDGSVTGFQYPNDFYYRDYPKYDPQNSIIPYYAPVLPTQQDYQVGEFRRYFCKKVNEVKYLEINTVIYNLLVQKSPTVTYPLYIPFYLDWQLTGDIKQVARVNKNTVELTSFQNKLPRLEEYLKFDYTKYYNQLGTTTSGSYINGVNQGYVLDNRDRRSNGVSYSQNDSGSVRRDSSITR